MEISLYRYHLLDQINMAAAFICMINIVLATTTTTIPEVTHTAQTLIAALNHQSGVAGHSSYKWAGNMCGGRMETVLVKSCPLYSEAWSIQMGNIIITPE